MRRNHMDLLRHQSQRTVKDGVRTTKHSLAGCVDCHADKETGSVLGRNAAGREGFCAECHRKVAASPDCFECHSSQRSARVAATRSRAMSPRRCSARIDSERGRRVRRLGVGRPRRRRDRAQRRAVRDRPRPRARRRRVGQGALGDARRRDPVRARLQRLRRRLREGKRLARRQGRQRSAVDPQGRPQGPRHWPHRVGAGDVPALRQPALRRRLPHRRLVQARRRHRAGGPAQLHRLPLLHDGLPVQGALVRVRAGDRPAARRAARPRLRRVLHAVRPPHRPRRHAGLRRGLRGGGPPGNRVRRPQRSGERDRPAGRDRGVQAAAAPTSTSRPACATRGSSDDRGCRNCPPLAPRPLGAGRRRRGWCSSPGSSRRTRWKPRATRSPGSTTRSSGACRTCSRSSSSSRLPACSTSRTSPRCSAGATTRRARRCPASCASRCSPEVWRSRCWTSAGPTAWSSR